MSTKHDGNDDLQQPEKSAADSWREKRKVRRRQREAEAEGITAAAADYDKMSASAMSLQVRERGVGLGTELSYKLGLVPLKSSPPLTFVPPLGSS